MSTPIPTIASVASSALGILIRSRREQTIDPSTGRTYTREGLGQVVGLTHKGIEAIENGRTKTISPADASRFARVLGITVADICEAMGYQIESAALTPMERDWLALLRRVPEPAQPSFVDATRAIARGAIEMHERLTPGTSAKRPTLRVADRDRG